MPKTATPKYYCVAYAQDWVANSSATPDKLFPGSVLFPNYNKSSDSWEPLYCDGLDHFYEMSFIQILPSFF